VQESNVQLNEKFPQCSITLLRKLIDFSLSNPNTATGVTSLGIDCTLVKELSPNHKVIDIVFSEQTA
jgi:hypothetical protein